VKSSSSYSQDDTSIPDAQYLGQKPPGFIPEVFAPGIVTTKYYEVFGVFTPDLQEFYFVRSGGKFKKPTLVVIQKKNNRWVESVVGSATGEPFISPDGKTMYLGNKYMERTNSGWSDVKSLGALFKDIPIMRLSISSNGTYFFDEREKIGTIRYSRFINGKREKPRVLGKNINTGKWTAHPFIAPDESYLIWDSERKNGYGDSDLYISFRQQGGSWGTAINMGDKINTALEENAASLTPDGKYIFFNRYQGQNSGKADLYWVDARVIETLRSQQ
jgi:Tol biopolymer transport system component